MARKLQICQAEADLFAYLKKKKRIKETYFALKDLEESGGFKQQAPKVQEDNLILKINKLLTKEADLSTFLHETAHYMLTVMEELVSSRKVIQRMIDDFTRY